MGVGMAPSISIMAENTPRPVKVGVLVMHGLHDNTSILEAKDKLIILLSASHKHHLNQGFAYFPTNGITYMVNMDWEKVIRQTHLKHNT